MCCFTPDQCFIALPMYSSSGGRRGRSSPLPPIGSSKVRDRRKHRRHRRRSLDAVNVEKHRRDSDVSLRLDHDRGKKALGNDRRQSLSDRRRRRPRSDDRGQKARPPRAWWRRDSSDPSSPSSSSSSLEPVVQSTSSRARSSSDVGLSDTNTRRRNSRFPPISRERRRH